MFRGHSIATLAIYPVQYKPVDGEISYYRSVSIQLQYEPHDPRTDSQEPVLDVNTHRALEYMVENSSFVDGPAGGIIPGETDATQGSIPVNSRYVVVTSQALAPAFNRFVEWKRRKGVSIEVVTIESIYAAYSGDLVSGIYDDAGKLRQFLKEAYNNGSGIEYALLAGKHNIVPIRYGWVSNNTELESHIIPTDLYFADFDGNWDSNGNGLYGEPDDNVDFYAEIYVGRLLVQSAQEVENWTDKLIQYENFPGNGDFGYLTRAFLTQADHLQQYGEADYIGARLTWCNEVEVFEEEGGYDTPETPNFPTGKDVVDEFNTHYGLASFFAHGGPRSVAVATQGNNGCFDPPAQRKVTSMDSYLTWCEIPEESNGFDNMTNSTHPTVFYSISCETMPFDEYKIGAGERNMGEAYTGISQGGGPAYIGNTRYGWVGSSTHLFSKFINVITSGLSYKIGKAEAISKQMIIDPYLRYSHNLLGCPETELWTAAPQRKYMDINYTSRSVRVVDESDTPLSDVLVVFADVQQRHEAITDQHGLASCPFAIGPYSQISATKHNYLPSYTYVLTEDETWSSQDQVRGNVLVPEGIKLTFSSDIEIPRYTSIMVEERGVLDIIGSSFHMKSKSKVYLAGGAKLYIRSNSILQVDACAELEVLPGGKVIVETAGVLQISHHAILNVHDGRGAFNLNNAAIIPQGFVNPSVDVPPAYRINGGVLEWNGAAYKMYRNMVLESGAKVTLNGTSLSFPQDSGIVVKPGAQLYVNGGTLTGLTGCGFTGLWRGIRVEGLPRAPHTEEYQGFLSIGPGTTISHAEVGVRVSNMNDADGGGILKVAGATFVDNIVGIRFGPYYSPNQSRVSSSTFTTTRYMARQGIIPKWFIKLNRITPVAIRDNTFHNTSPESYSLTDRGYGVMAQDADVYIDTKFVANTFTNLFTAVNAVSTRDVPSLTVRGAIITDCFNGIHVSGYPMSLVEGCSIRLPYEAYQDRVPTGISAEALNSIFFRGNAIMGNGMGYGIFLNDRVGLSGIIGENVLDYLQVGVMAASGEPSHVPGFTSSVQLQCNWFSDNLLADIYVTGNGVANEQGTKRISASNRFLGRPDYNIFSSTMPLTYYAYRNDFFPSACNDKVVVLEAERLADCGIIIPLRGMEDIARYNDSLNLACDMLLALQDMGETGALVETVEGEDNPLILRNVLLRSSPLLSDTVMVTASDDAVPLPNLMLAQVLMSNPQAAKSAAVLQALNERENTLPDYLMEAIHDAGSGYSPIDGAKSEIAFHRVNRDILAGRLLARFTADTLGKPYDSIRMLPDYHPDRIYRYLSAFTHVEQGNHEEALAALQSMAGEPGLTPGQLQETEGVTRLVNILAGLEQADIPLELMDSGARANIEEMATQGVGLAALLAGNVLVIADRIPFLAQELALGDAHSGTHSGEWSILLELEPYPVTDYVVAVYDMGSKPCRTPRISVVNSKGDVMYNELLTRSRFQILVEVEGWSPGAYTVQLADGELALAQRSFLIMGHDGGSEYEESETHELLSNAGISIHPNPTDGQFTIEVRGCGGECRFAYEVIDPSGTTLLTGNGNTSKALSLSHLSKGTYLVVVTLGGERLVQPVVLR